MHFKIVIYIIVTFSHIIEAFNEACLQGSVTVVETFMKQKSFGDIVTKKGAVGGLNALQIAAMHKRSNVVEVLLKRYLHDVAIVQ